jgi:hypothetical protein
VVVEAIAAAKVTLAVQVEVRRVKVATALPNIAIGEDKDRYKEVLTLN